MPVVGCMVEVVIDVEVGEAGEAGAAKPDFDA